MDRLSRMTVCLTALLICATPAWGASSPPRCRQVDSASVTVACTLQADGSLTDCAVVRESAPGCGFAEEAIEGMARARIRLTDTVRPGDRVEMTFQFGSQ